MSTVEQKKAQRVRYLRRLYDFSDGNALRDVPYAVIGRALEWDDDTSDRVTAYLKNGGLIDFPAVGKVRLTHKGVKQVEKSLSRSRRAPRRTTSRCFVTLSAEGNIHIGGDVVGRDKISQKSSPEK
jgi:hypothetical protein